MTKIVLIRGAPAVGKTTITQKVLKLLKTEYGIDCAYICEDDFRKQMQFKYKANEIRVHFNSFELIKTVILKLLEFDSYQMIFVEGQFRYKEVLDKYREFILENKFDSIIFQFNLDIEEMKKRDVELRDTKSRDIEDVKRDIDAYTAPNTIFIETNKQIDENISKIIAKLINFSPA